MMQETGVTGNERKMSSMKREETIRETQVTYGIEIKEKSVHRYEKCVVRRKKKNE